MAKKVKNLPEVVPELFEHDQFGQFRYIKRDEEIWFAAVDACRALDIQNPTMAVKQLDNDERAKFNLGHPYGEMNFVNEFGLYNLILSSRKPEAKKFKRWVTHEVLPSIRRYGFYGFLNGERALQLPDKEYIRYLGKLTLEQYDSHLKQLTPKQRGEHYWRIEEMIPNMTQEEIKSLANDPYIIVSRIGNAPWKASY